MKPNVLKPGLLVSLHTRVCGGVSYRRTDLDVAQPEDGARVARWETLRQIDDPAEFARASDMRSKARQEVARICCATSFGLLCPNDREADLGAAIESARAMIDSYNSEARLSRVELYAIVGRIAIDDVEAMRAIRAEVSELLTDMQRGIRDADVETIREAASKARAVGAMLNPDAAGKVDSAINEARKAAREIVKRVQNAGETAAVVVAEVSTQAIESARFAFLDLDESGKPIESEAPAARGLDLEPAPVTATGPQQIIMEL